MGSVEAMSLDGTQPLLRRQFPVERHEQLQADLTAAEADHVADPDGVDAIVWHARRLGYLDRYTEAIGVLTRGLEIHPHEPQLYRHRGHRYITVRKYQAAVADFTAAARLCEGQGGVPDSVEPDGAPNPSGIPTSTLHTNIYYHLGLARFLLGQYQQAVDAYRKGLSCELCTTTMRVAFSDWLYMSLRRLGKTVDAAEALAAAGDENELVANFSYQKRLQLYKGLIGPEEVLSPVRVDCGRQDSEPLDVATQGFGVADWYLARGQVEEAVALLTQVANSDHWPSFAACAAESDLLRLSKAPKSTVVFWIRHAHGTHNAAQEDAEAQFERGNPDRAAADYSKRRRQAVWGALYHGHYDADLTERGIAQATALRSQATAMIKEHGLQLVISSSMRRTLATAAGAFGDAGQIPIVAMDELREVAGTFDCERRRPLEEIAAQFVHVDVSSCSAVDELWVEDREQATAAALDRAVQALDIIAERPERVVAVVSHGATMGVVFKGAETYGVARHPRVVCELEPPRRNCEVVATLLTKDHATGMLTLSAYNAGDATAKL